jgi:hypothetical protein
MSEEERSASDPIRANYRRIEVDVAELKQLFNTMDPSPLRERDLDPDTEEFIVGWGRELPRDAPLALVVYLDRPAGLPQEPGSAPRSVSSSPSAPRPDARHHVSSVRGPRRCARGHALSLAGDDGFSESSSARFTVLHDHSVPPCSHS